jgi:hypothetical protein
VRLLLFLGLVTALVGCGQENAKEPAIVDEALVSYVVKFELDVGVSAGAIDVTFGDLDDDIVGMCYSWKDGRRKIVIDKQFWDIESETQREELMFHELGHCAMNLGHDEEISYMGRTSCPNSVMYPYAFEYCYERYRDYYVSELKNKTWPKIYGARLGAKTECTRAHLHK